MMEWDEFTRFVVVKAQLHHAQMSIDQLAEYRQGLKQVMIPRLGSTIRMTEAILPHWKGGNPSLFHDRSNAHVAFPY